MQTSDSAGQGPNPANPPRPQLAVSPLLGGHPLCAQLTWHPATPGCSVRVTGTPLRARGVPRFHSRASRLLSRSLTLCRPSAHQPHEHRSSFPQVVCAPRAPDGARHRPAVHSGPECTSENGG